MKILMTKQQRTTVTLSLLTILLLSGFLSCKDKSSSAGLEWDESPEKYVSTDDTNPFDILIVDNTEEEYDLFAEVQSDAKDLMWEFTTREQQPSQIRKLK